MVSGFLVGHSRLGFFDQHLRAEVHELSRAEVLVGVEELLACQFAFAVLVVAVLIPYGVAGVGVLAEVVGWVGNNQLSVWDAVHLEVLKVVVE